MSAGKVCHRNATRKVPLFGDSSYPVANTYKLVPQFYKATGD